MKPGTKYLLALIGFISALVLSIVFKDHLSGSSREILKSEMVNPILAIVTFAVSLTHKLRYSTFKVHQLNYDEFKGFGEEVLSLFSAPVTTAGSWALLSRYLLQEFHNEEYFKQFSEMELTFLFLISTFFLLSSLIKVWKQFLEIKANTTPVEATTVTTDGQSKKPTA